MNKKWLVGIAGALMGISLAACGSQAVATTNGGKITQSQYYSSMKQTSNGKQVLQQMILDKLLEHKYGNQVSDSKVNSQFNQYKSQYGSQFSALLQQQGMTASSLKQQIRDNLLVEQAVKDNTKFTDAMLQKQFKSYQPKVTVQRIVVKNASDANKVISQLKSGKNFNTVMKKYSLNKTTNGKVTFDNTSSTVDSTTKNAAFKLKNGEYTKSPVKSQGAYQIIKMINHPVKGNYKDHISDLKDQIIANKLKDQTTTQNVISKVLKNGNVDIKDKDLKNILANYINPTSASNSTK